MSFPPDKEVWASSLVATASVAVSCILVFHPWLRSVVSPSTAVLSPTWALIIGQVHAGSVFFDGVRSVMGALIGACFGLLAYMIAEQAPIDGVSRHVLASLIAVPFAFFLCLSDSVVNSPLSQWLRQDAALMSLYIVASFSKLNAYQACANTIISFSFGSLSAIAVASFVRLFTSFGSTKRNLEHSLHALHSAQTHWLEGLVGFMTSVASDHFEELEERQETASKNLRKFQQSLAVARSGDPWSVSRFPDTSSQLGMTAVLMHSQLLAFRATIAQEGYRGDTIRSSFVPLSEQFNALVMCVVLALRPSTPDRVKERSRRDLKLKARQLFTAFIANAEHTAANRCSDLPQGSEVVRLHCAVMSLIRFSLLLDKCSETAVNATCLHGPLTSMKIFWMKKIKNLFSLSSWRTDTLNLRHACRSVVAQQLGAQIALLVAREAANDFGPYILWAQLPVIFCFLPTVGGSFIKGSRRVLGTLAGGAIACLTAFFNPATPSAFFLETLIFTFIAKLLSFHPSVGYSGSVLGFTWYILTLSSIYESDLTLLLTGVFYRMVLTVGGVTASFIFGALLFPSFSSCEMRSVMSKTISACTALVVDGVGTVLKGEPFEVDVLSSESVDFQNAGDKALKSLHKFVGPLPQLFSEARAEVSFIKILARSSRIPSVSRLIACEDVLNRFLDSVCVFSATAASTRISEYAHSLFLTEHVVHALESFAVNAKDSGTKLAANVNALKYSMDECYVGDCLDDVDRNLMAVRCILGACKKLPLAVKGGSPLLYVFHFALCEMADRWDDLVRAMDGKTDTFAEKPQRFRRISSSLSSLSII